MSRSSVSIYCVSTIVRQRQILCSDKAVFALLSSLRVCFLIIWRSFRKIHHLHHDSDLPKQQKCRNLYQECPFLGPTHTHTHWGFLWILSFLPQSKTMHCRLIIISVCVIASYDGLPPHPECLLLPSPLPPGHPGQSSRFLMTQYIISSV